MNRPSVIAIVALVTITFTWSIFQLRGPRHGGKSVDEWLTAVNSTNESARSEAATALRALGTNALPAMLGRVDTEDSAMHSNVVRLLKKQRVVPVPASPTANAYREARYGMQALGTNAHAAIPELIKMLDDPRTANRASGLLVEMGDEVIPALLIAITNANVEVRGRAIVDLGYRRVNAPGVVSALITRLALDPDSGIRSLAATMLRSVPELPDTAIEPLTKALEDTGTASAAAQTLGDSFGPRAKAAVPALVKLWQNHGTSPSAAGALTKIDPEAARKNGALMKSRPPNSYE